MDPTVLIAVISFAGTATGAIGGILAANKMTNFRLKKLEEKVDKHNCFDSRLTAVDESTKSAHHRIDELRDEIRQL